MYTLAKCREDSFADGVDFDQLSVGTQWTRRLAYEAKEARKYIARLRAKLPAPQVGDDRLPNLRYLLVAEKHSQGSDDTRPHFHVLLHSIHSSHPVPTGPKVLANGQTIEAWPHLLEEEWAACGFSQWRPVTASNCTYLCKYLSKDADNRVRASENYGAFDYAGVNALSIALLRKRVETRPLKPSGYPAI